MPKLIDANKLKEHYAWWDNEDKKIFDTIVDLQPEAVVRCKVCRFASLTYDGECKYCQRWKEKHDGESVSLYLDGDFYCAWGERKEDGNKPKSI